MKKQSYYEALILSVIFVSLAAVFLQIHRYFVTEEAAYFPAKEMSSDSASVKFDNLIMKNVRHIYADKVLVDILKNSHPNQVDISQDYYLDRCEVRQGEYYRFSKWLDTNPNEAYSLKHKNEPLGHPYVSSSETHKILYRPENPATGVSFYNAYAYCKASGGRLPTVDEWEVAGGGKEGSIYPWGNEFTDAAWKNPEPVYNVAVTCGQYSDMKTSDGIEDMGNGVSEWTIHHDDSSDSFLSGGNAFHKPFEIYAMRFIKKQIDPTTRDRFVGFRCVYDTPTTQTPWESEINTVRINSGSYSLGTPIGSITPLLFDSLSEDKNGKPDIPLLREMYGKFLNPQPFRLSRYEVTVWEFMFFLYDPLTILGVYDHPEKPSDHDYKPLEWGSQVLNPFSSIYGIDWWTAYAFAKRRNGRLPTEEEWNRAYTNEFKTKYPWGDKTFEGAAVNRFWQVYQTTGYKQYITDINDKGIVHLTGNVSEWTSSFIFSNGVYEMIIKGGNYILPAASTSSLYFRLPLNPNIKDLSTGIRLVMDVP